MNCTKQRWRKLYSFRSHIRWINIVGPCSAMKSSPTNTIVDFGKCAKKHRVLHRPCNVSKKTLTHQPNTMSALMLNIYVMSYRSLYNFNSIKERALRPANTTRSIRIACCPTVIFMGVQRPGINSNKCYRLDHQNHGQMRWKY